MNKTAKTSSSESSSTSSIGVSEKVSLLDEAKANGTMKTKRNAKFLAGQKSVASNYSIHKKVTKRGKNDTQLTTKLPMRYVIDIAPEPTLKYATSRSASAKQRQLEEKCAKQQITIKLLQEKLASVKDFGTRKDHLSTDTDQKPDDDIVVIQVEEEG